MRLHYTLEFSKYLLQIKLFLLNLSVSRKEEVKREKLRRIKKIEKI